MKKRERQTAKFVDTRPKKSESEFPSFNPDPRGGGVERKCNSGGSSSNGGRFRPRR